MANLNGSSLKAADWNEFNLGWQLSPFGYQTKAPVTVQAAERGGWVRDHSCSQGSSFANRYYNPRPSKGKPYHINPIYNVAGALSGLQTCLYVSKPFGGKLLFTNGGPVETRGGMSCVTMYFRDPATLCTNSETRPAAGSVLWIRVGNRAGYQLLVDDQAESRVPSVWVKGKCFVTMGVHYWYNITQSTRCDELFPVFLLYSGSRLNAWGWVFPLDPVEEGFFENPSPSDTRMFLPDDGAPACLYDGSLSKLTTLHVAFNNPILSNNC